MIVKLSFSFGAGGGGLSVSLGAFGAHGLHGRVEDRLVETFKTAVE